MLGISLSPVGLSKKTFEISFPPRITTDVILPAMGQSNQLNGHGGAPDAVLDRFPDNAVVLNYNATAVSAPNIPPSGTLFGVNNGWGGNPSPAIQMAKLLAPRMAAGKKIIVLPLAVPSTGLCATTGNPYWDPAKTGGGNAGISYQDTLDRLTKALALYPGAKVIASWLQGENDAGIATSVYKSTFTALVAGLRSIPGAEQTEFVIHRMLILPTTASNKLAIDRAHRELALDLPRVVFAGAVTGEDDSLQAGVGVHFTAAGQRKAGAKGAALQPYIATLYAAPPSEPTDFKINGNNYSFKVPSTFATGYDVEIQDVAGGPWRVYPIYPAEGAMPGEVVTGRVPGIRNVVVRIRAKSRGASGIQYSPYTPILPCVSGNWWNREIISAVDFTNNRAYIHGVSYDTIAAAVTAGALVVASTGHYSTIVVPAAYTFLSRGVLRATELANGSAETLAFLDDGSGNNMARSNYWWYTGGSPHIGGHAVTAGAAIGNNISLMENGAVAAAGGAVRNAFRVKSTDFASCMNGSVLKKVTIGDAPTGITTLRIGVGPSGNASWTGTKGLVEVTSVVFDDDELLRETAA